MAATLSEGGWSKLKKDLRPALAHALSQWKDYAGILVGVSITALALDLFLVPHRIAAGGASGLATILHVLFRLPVGLTILAINIPLLLASIRTFGRHFGAKTIFGTFALSLMVDIGAMFLKHPLTQNPVLAALYGGVVAGIGMGLTFRFNGTTGGTDLAARLLNHYTPLSIGRALLIIDMSVIILAGFAFRDPDLALYALIAVFVTSKAIDTLLEGADFAKAAFIVTERPDEITQAVFTNLGRGVTALQGRGGYTGMDRQVLLCVVGRSEQNRLREIIGSLDPHAFVIFTAAHEVLGEGFKAFDVKY